MTPEQLFRALLYNYFFCSILYLYKFIQYIRNAMTQSDQVTKPKNPVGTFLIKIYEGA